MTNSERVIAYLENSLSDVERKKFESELNNQSELQNELRFQQDIINGIKAARKSELKAMLNNVPVSGGWTSQLGGQAIKWAGASALAVLISTSAYFIYTENNSAANSITEIEISDEYVDSVLGFDTQTILNNISEPFPEEQLSEEDARKTSRNISIKKSAAPVINTPKLIDPLVQEKAGENFETPENDTKFTETLDEPVVVSIISSDKKHQFHYQFKNSDLILYGDFSETYEVLDLQKNGKRSLYLYYMDAYYPLDLKQEKIMELSLLKDNILLHQLKSIR